MNGKRAGPACGVVCCGFRSAKRASGLADGASLVKYRQSITALPVLEGGAMAMPANAIAESWGTARPAARP
jgi:hypothetical protein